MKKYLCIGEDGFPVEGIIGRPIKTFIRRLLLTRRFEKTDNWERRTGLKMRFD